LRRGRLSGGRSAVAQGTWKGSGQGIGRTEGWTNDQVTIEITEQRGPAFKAQVVYGNQREDLFGIVAPDGRTVHILGDDGQNIGVLSAPDTLDVCYLEVGSDAKATCVVLKRAP
jgi:hypothetical protein